MNISLSQTGKNKAKILRMEIAGHIRKNLERLPAEDRERFYQTVEFLMDISRKFLINVEFPPDRQDSEGNKLPPKRETE